MPYDTPYSASPSMTRQAPNFNALMKTAILVVEGKPLATEPVALEYFEPGINKKLVRRTKPKTDYTLPSDLPTFPLGFVPTSSAVPGPSDVAALVKVPELVNADLIDVFAKIRAESVADQLPRGKLDMGTRTAKAFQAAVTKARESSKIEGMIDRGFTEEETMNAMKVIRDEEVVKMARMPAAPISVMEALKGAFGNGNGNGDPMAP